MCSKNFKTGSTNFWKDVTCAVRFLQYFSLMQRWKWHLHSTILFTFRSPPLHSHCAQYEIGLAILSPRANNCFCCFFVTFFLLRFSARYNNVRPPPPGTASRPQASFALNIGLFGERREVMILGNCFKNVWVIAELPSMAVSKFVDHKDSINISSNRHAVSLHTVSLCLRVCQRKIFWAHHTGLV